jgi:hypothetical protein
MEMAETGRVGVQTGFDCKVSLSLYKIRGCTKRIYNRKMIKLLLIIFIIIVVFVLWILAREKTDFLALHQNGYFNVDSRGLAPKNIALSLDLKTRMPGAVLLFGGTNTLQNLAVLYIRVQDSGLVRVMRTSRNNRDNPSEVTLTSIQGVMDGRWHSVAFSIDDTTATLIVDNIPTTATWPVAAFDMMADVATLGGSENIRDERLFVGCLRNVTFGPVRPSTFHFVPSERTSRLGVTAPDCACC